MRPSHPPDHRLTTHPFLLANLVLVALVLVALAPVARCSEPEGPPAAAADTQEAGSAADPAPEGQQPTPLATGYCSMYKPFDCSTDGYCACDISCNRIFCGEGDDTVYGTSGCDCIFTCGGDDTIYGLGGDDYLCGGSGTDTLDGGTGSDTCQQGEILSNCE